LSFQNWIGEVTTTDNTHFKIENTKMIINPGSAVAVRFFVRYNTLNPTPKLKTIRLNGREICSADNPLPVVGRPERPGSGSSRPETRPSNPKPETRPSPTPRPEIPLREDPVDDPIFP
jgi:hypothetical protein